MSENLSPRITENKNELKYKIMPIAFTVIAIAGLFYVKWNPYYSKAFVAASKHSIGASIITGKAQIATKPSLQTAWSYAINYFNAVWKAVILGLLLGSLIQVLLPQDWIKKVIGKTGFSSTAAASAASLPGMMCTCCAAPVTVGLRKSSASVNASLAFFLGSPVLNPATIIFMGFVLSWKLAIFRIIMGIILVFGISTFASRFEGEEDAKEEIISLNEVEDKNKGLFTLWMKALWRLIVETIPAYLIVVTLLGTFRAWLFPILGSQYSNSIFAIILLAVTGTLFVIPTAAEIPVIQTLMAFGLGMGPAATLLITLPAVSLPSLLIVRRAFSKKVLVFVGVAVVIIGIVSGVLGMLLL
jgi:uncharacterized membrane protein YraQ (UPF0718 family)